ncbi:putative serine protease K12H4.7 [Neocloeon triangulifer]|uniref:putative serine protease K12H4.7 n=1 Tax=Neocloeon triangulifer TaxID=2078957 RepID=UPI00286F8175|nr:putative serine protease K12H4.7 [Neocloeon triangulifer]
MARLTIFFIICLSSSLLAQEYFNPFKLFRREIFPELEAYNGTAYREEFFTQKLDHFEILDGRTWQQRYFVTNATYTSGAPIFLVLGGEWEANPVHIENGFIQQLVDHFGAYAIYLDYRFYGQSRPFPDLLLENLVYLNMEQALEDTAYFTQKMKDDFGLDGKWILIGASFTGDMTAWARARYPHLYHAAYSSGAPVQAQVEVAEYFEVVGRAYQDTDPNCSLVIETAMRDLQKLVQNGEAATITQLFNLVEEIDLSVQDDVTLLYFVVTQIYGSLVQASLPGSLEKVCSRLTDSQQTPLEAFATVYRETIFNIPLRIDASRLVESYRNQTEYRIDITRQFMYQSCLEFGWFTTVSSENQPFGQVVPIEFRLNFCSSVFGPEFTRERLEAGVARTNLLYGGKKPNVSRVVYTVGSLDPFNPVQMSEEPNPDAPLIIIEGASHCVDITSPATPDEPAAFTAARAQVVQLLTQWMAQD